MANKTVGEVFEEWFDSRIIENRTKIKVIVWDAYSAGAMIAADKLTDKLSSKRRQKDDK